MMKSFGKRSDTPIAPRPALGAAKAKSATSAPAAGAAAAPAAPAAAPAPSSKLRELAASKTGGDGGASSKARDDLRTAVFKDLLDAIDLTELARMDSLKAKIEVAEVVRSILEMQPTPLDVAEQEGIVEEIINDVLGLGPLEPLLARDDIADIMVNGPNKVYIEVGGKIQLTPIKFRDEAQLINICRRIVSAVGRRVDESSPICDARLFDGSRVNVIAPPLAIDGTALTIRKFKKEKLSLDDLVKFGSISKAGATILRIASTVRCNILVSGGTGSGKAQPLDAKVLTPTGWREMGSLSVGDIVTAADGTATSVTGVFPQGDKEIYRITFEDGRTVECCDDHLWKVWTRTSEWCPERKKKVRGMGWRVVTLAEIRGWFARKRSMWKRTAVPLVAPLAVELPARELAIDPYSLGMLLGDGNLTGQTPVVSNEDECVLRLTELGMPEHEFRTVPDSRCDHRLAMRERRKSSGLRVELERLGLLGLCSHEKFVPEEYKTGSVAQRLMLLQGLVDTDGGIDRTSVTFTSTSERLAKDVQEIAWSLGAIASITDKVPAHTHNGERRVGRRAHTVHIRHPDHQLFSFLPRKDDASKERETDLRLRVTAIEPVGVKPAQCIAVEHPDHLYVTDNFVVTHNTTLLNCITRYIDPGERVITCEDAAELQLQQPHVVRLETRPANLEGVGAITMTDLVKNCLRMRPERIIVGEIRGKEAFDLLQAMNTGHDGSAGTLHANSPREAIGRVESMIAQGGFTLPAKTVREQIVASVDLVVQAMRMRDGSRKITHITEVIGLEGETVTLQDLILFEHTGEDANGKIIGRHRSTGMRPHFYDKARYYGLEKELMSAMQEAL